MSLILSAPSLCFPRASFFSSCLLSGNQYIREKPFTFLDGYKGKRELLRFYAKIGKNPLQFYVKMPKKPFHFYAKTAEIPLQFYANHMQSG